MLKYSLTLYAIVAAAAARLGRLRLAWIVGFGIGARLSVLFAFMLVVQLAVHTLKQVGFHLPYPLSEIHFDSHIVLPLSFIVVPALFYFAGWTMVHAQKLAAQFVSDFVFETRRSNVKANTHTLLVEPMPSRRKLVQEFAQRNEPEIARAARALVGGLITLLQCLMICVALLITLGVVDWKILLVVFLVSATVVPRYVKKSYIWHLEDLKRLAETSARLREGHLGIADGQGVKEGDPVMVQDAFLELLDGETTRKEARDLLDRQLAPRRFLPPLYAILGFVVGMLLYETAHMCAAEKAQAVGQFATTLMVLRFLVGEVAALLGAFRQIHTGYPHADKICAVLRHRATAAAPAGTDAGLSQAPAEEPPAHSN